MDDPPKLSDLQHRDPGEEWLARAVRDLEAEERRREESARRLKALALVATAGMMIPGGVPALLPAPKRFDCPKCQRSKLRHSGKLTYCQRCSYLERR